MVGTRCAASDFCGTSPVGNACQTPERQGDAVSRAVDFGRSQRVPTNVDRGAESKTRISARGLW
jgi:hypothetical protein